MLVSAVSPVTVLLLPTVYPAVYMSELPAGMSASALPADTSVPVFPALYIHTRICIYSSC